MDKIFNGLLGKAFIADIGALPLRKWDWLDCTLVTRAAAVTLSRILGRTIPDSYRWISNWSDLLGDYPHSPLKTISSFEV